MQKETSADWQPAIHREQCLRDTHALLQTLDQGAHRAARHPNGAVDDGQILMGRGGRGKGDPAAPSRVSGPYPGR